MGLRVFGLGLLLLAGGCAARTTAPPAVTPSTLMAEADALARAGCFDCLLEARRQYERLVASPPIGEEAREAAIKLSVLIAVREAELGLAGSGAIAHAHALAGDHPSDSASVYLDFGDAFASDVTFGTASGEVTLARIRSRQEARERGFAAAAILRTQMPDDPVATALWFGLACSGAGSALPDKDRRDDIVGWSVDQPAVVYQNATACPGFDRLKAQALFQREPRFVELNYFLGLSAMSGQERIGATVGRPDLDSADAYFTTAYAWRQDWPAITLAIATVAVTAEDFDRAFDFYDRTLALIPDHPNALLGKVRALTYLKRHLEAIATTDQMLAAGSSPADARYWRAYNETQLDDFDAAWEDIEIASRMVINAEVPKLAGIIAARRRDLPVARQRLELAVTRRVSGCDTGFYLQAVTAEQGDWTTTARVAATTAQCLEDEIGTLTGEIAGLQTTEMSADRRARQIQRREAEIAADRRMRATTWFNAAAAHFNLQQGSAAREFANKLLDDPQFADRVRVMLDRLNAP